MKFCKDCVHYYYNFEDYCHRNVIESKSYVDNYTFFIGEELTCKGQRYPSWLEKVFGDVCGPEGKYFVGKSE